MWVRKRIEIAPRHLFYGLCRCLLPGDREKLMQRIVRPSSKRSGFVCLSVRSGFDLLLQSSGWQNGTEIIMSGLTIPDMSRIVTENGMVPRGVDIDLDSMTPRLDQIEAQITPRTRAIVVAHLFGGLCDVTPIIELARRHDLFVIEDCAQAYVGSRYQGHPSADVSMFSFGPIKTNTALGGAVFRVGSPDVLQRLKAAQREWPVQSRLAFSRRCAKYAIVRLLSTRLVCGSIYKLMRLFGTNHDGLASRMARGFAGPRFFSRIRQQPSTPLLGLMDKKLSTYEEKSARERQELGQAFVDSLGSDQYVVGAQMIRPTFWVLPILVEDPQPLVKHLWDKGFDASRSCSLSPIELEDDSLAQFVLDHIVFLPFHVSMSRREIMRMANVIRRFGPVCPPLPKESEVDFQSHFGSNLPHSEDFSKPALV